MEIPQALWASSSSNFLLWMFYTLTMTFFLVFRWTFRFSKLLLLSLVLSLDTTGSLFIPCNQICVQIDKNPQMILFMLNSAKSPSLSSYEKCSRPLIIFMAFAQFVDFLLNSYNPCEKNLKQTTISDMFAFCNQNFNKLSPPVVGSLFFLKFVIKSL